MEKQYQITASTSTGEIVHKMYIYAETAMAALNAYYKRKYISKEDKKRLKITFVCKAVPTLKKYFVEVLNQNNDIEMRFQVLAFNEEKAREDAYDYFFTYGAETYFKDDNGKDIIITYEDIKRDYIIKITGRSGD